MNGFLQSSRTEEIFFIVNPKSGGNKGEDFLKVPQPFLVALDDGRTVNLRIYSILDGESGSKPGFMALKQALAGRSSPIKLVVGGGDGTVMFADGECEKHGIDTRTQVVFGIVPLGTGNDFSRSYGWGGMNPSNILDDDCLVVKQLVRGWAAGIPCKHDVWEVTLTVNPKYESRIFKVNKEKEEEPLKEQVITKLMVNYFSIGQESKAGISFDKYRTKSQIANLLVYGCAGCWHELDCTQDWSHIGSVVGSLHEGTTMAAPMIFNQDRYDEVSDLVGNPECLMFLNIDSYAGGKCHFWQLENDVGLEPAPLDERVEVEQDPGDGKLEVVTVPSLLSIGIDKAVSMSKRVHSGGPYYVHFEDDDDTPEELEAWCQIDGEFFHLLNPMSATVIHKKCLQVLRCTEAPTSALDDALTKVRSLGLVGVDGRNSL